MSSMKELGKESVGNAKHGSKNRAGHDDDDSWDHLLNTLYTNKKSEKTSKSLVQTSDSDKGVRSCVVATRAEALELVVPPGGANERPLKILKTMLIKFFWSQLPILIKFWGFVISTRGCISYCRGHGFCFDKIFNFVNADNRQHLDLATLLHIFYFTLNLFILGILLPTFLLLPYRIVERLSWQTHEFKIQPSIKDDERYQDKELLDKAWKLAFANNPNLQKLISCHNQTNDKHSTPLVDPTTYSDFEPPLGGGPALVQPRSGYCGLATLNSTLRLFGGSGKINSDGNPSGSKSENGTCSNNGPYIKLHPRPRYVTLEEMVKLVQKLVVHNCSSNNPNSDSVGELAEQWQQMGGTPIHSFQIAGGGPRHKSSIFSYLFSSKRNQSNASSRSNKSANLSSFSKGGFTTLEQFKMALRQLSYPAQPTQIMAIYHRMPLFFCNEASSKSSFKKLFHYMAVHWSPIVAYLEEEELVLVLDVNHDYGPRGYLVPVERMWESVNTVDCFTGKYHGLIILRGFPQSSDGGSVEESEASDGGSIENPLSPLLVRPSDLTYSFGELKKAYYQEQTCGLTINASDAAIPSSCADGMIFGITLSRRDTRDNPPAPNDPPDPMWGVSCFHPAFFTNEIFLERNFVPSLASFQSMMKVFAELRVPPRICLRGYDKKKAREAHNVLIRAGMVRIVKRNKVMYLNLETLPASWTDGNCEGYIKVADGYSIQEFVFDPNNQNENDSNENGGSDFKLANELGTLIEQSYSLPKGARSIERHGYNLSQYFGKAYQTFPHGGKLRHYICLHKETGELAACVALFYDPASSCSSAAAIFNVCTYQKHRRKGLGLAVTRHAILEARKQGCKQVILEASTDGRKLYQAMGFFDATEEYGGAYVSLSTAATTWKWKMIFWLLELFFRFKNGGLWYYAAVVFGPSTALIGWLLSKFSAEVKTKKED